MPWASLPGENSRQFSIERGARYGDPISALSFISVTERIFQKLSKEGAEGAGIVIGFSLVWPGVRPFQRKWPLVESREGDSAGLRTADVGWR